MNPDRLAELEEERRFLLRSLRDLDAELAAGDVDVADHETLRDGYTKRAAGVLRDIETGRSALPARRPVRWGRRLAGALVVVALAVGAGVVVARSSGQRVPGQQITGGPTDDVAVQLADARTLLGEGDLVGAQEIYGQVLQQRPDQPEALPYSGWLLFIGSSGASEDLRAAAVDTAKQQLARAVEADAAYPDPHCFLAVIAARHDGDTATAATEAQRCLDLDPPAQVRGLVVQFVEGLEAPTTTM